MLGSRAASFLIPAVVRRLPKADCRAFPAMLLALFLTQCELAFVGLSFLRL